MFDYFRGNTSRDRIGRHIMSDHRICAYDCAIPDVHTGKDTHITANPDVLTNTHRTLTHYFSIIGCNIQFGCDICTMRVISNKDVNS